MKSNVRDYTGPQLLTRVESLDTFEYFPTDYWLIGIRSEEDEVNRFDDKFCLMHGTRYVKEYTGTTHTGIKGLKDFASYNPKGAAILKSDTIIYNSHERGISKGRGVYRQFKSWPYFRDNNKNDRVEEIGEEYYDIIHCHIHDCKLGPEDDPKEYINGWSLGCQVMNDSDDWEDFFDVKTKDQEFMTLCILKEFEV